MPLQLPPPKHSHQSTTTLISPTLPIYPTLHSTHLPLSIPPSTAIPIPTTTTTNTTLTTTNTDNIQLISHSSHIIQLSTLPTDPLDPPRFKHRRIPLPSQPLPPLLHSPPHSLTLTDHSNWLIPPCISHWKNLRGHILPLDKRCMVSSNSSSISVSDGFARLGEALLIAEREAREEVKRRRDVVEKERERVKSNVEREMRELAESVVVGGNADRDSKRKQREASGEIELGVQQKKRGGTTYDTRLFQQASGISSKLSNDDGYTVYDKPLYGDRSSGIYRPKTSGLGGSVGDGELKRLVSEYRFEKGGPVEFERGSGGVEGAEESRKVAEDVFGLDGFLSKVDRI